MRKDIAGVFFVAVGVLLSVLAGVSIYRGAEKRIALAPTWSNEDFAFRAEGNASRTLAITPINFDDDKKPLACALVIGSIVTDAHLSGELREAGFTQISCNGQYGELNPAQ